ncbi:MAG TPA: amino acid--tRNA ligase-related protein [Chthoniobacterales bacterium]
MKFYHFRSETNPDVAERADLIFRGVEIITTSRREHRYMHLVEQLRAIGADPDHPGYRYYLQAFRHGMPSHAGFGLGLERLTQKIVGFANVKEATLFPRDPVDSLHEFPALSRNALRCIFNAWSDDRCLPAE